MKEISFKLYDIAPVKVQRTIDHFIVETVGKHLKESGIELKITQPSNTVEPEIVPPKQPTNKRIPINVNSRTFPSLAKACNFYNISYQRVRQMVKEGIPYDEIFIEKKTKVLKRDTSPQPMRTH